LFIANLPIKATPESVYQVCMGPPGWQQTLGKYKQDDVQAAGVKPTCSVSYAELLLSAASVAPFAVVQWV
jgi:hypothetical protein